MRALENVAPDFFGRDQQSDSLVGRLASGARGHRSRVKSYKGLQDAAANGQKPQYAIYYNGPTPGPAFLGLAPSQALCASDLLLVPRRVEPGQSPPPIVAVAEFAERLGVERHVMVFNSAVDVNYFADLPKKTGPFIASWKKSLDRTVAGIEKPASRKTNAAALRRRIGQQLLIQNAANLEHLLGIEVTPLYYDASANTLTGYTRRRKGAPFTVSATRPTTLPLFAPRNGFPRAVGCSCCDSRALHGHIYCAQPGEFLESNSMAAIIPPHEKSLAARQPHSIWAKIEYAHDVLDIREYSVTGHSKCGGIDALVAWCETGAPPPGFIGAWLQQAYPVIQAIVAYAKRDRFFNTREKLCNLAEMRVTQWSAGNLKSYSPRSQVLPLFLDIKTRMVYPLPAIDPKDGLHRSLAKTAHIVRALHAGTLPTLSEIEAEVERTARARQRKISGELIAARRAR